MRNLNRWFLMRFDPESLIAEVEDLARQVFADIEDVLPEVQTMVGALDYETSRARALFEPIDAETFRVAQNFLRGDQTSVGWHRQSSYAVRPDDEAFSVAIALLALTEEGVLHLVDAIPVFAKWRDGRFLRTRGRR
jgi:hypothetical protein